MRKKEGLWTDDGGMDGRKEGAFLFVFVTHVCFVFLHRERADEEARSPQVGSNRRNQNPTAVMMRLLLKMMKAPAPLLRRARARDASTRRGGGFGLDDDDAGVSSLPPRRWRRGARDRRARRRRREARARDDDDDCDDAVDDDDARFDVGRAVVCRAAVRASPFVASSRGFAAAGAQRAQGGRLGGDARV